MTSPHRGTAVWPAPLAPAGRVVLRLGPFAGVHLSPTLPRLPTTARLTLRIRTAQPVQVRVERQAQVAWQALCTLELAEGSTLVKAAGRPVRVWVTGTSAGWVELIETHP